MLYALLYPLADQFQVFNLFRYITFRSGGAVVTALLISFVFGRPIIAWLRSKQTNGQPIRLDGPAGHLVRKKGTPTMGGFLILLALTVATLLWADLTNPYVWIVLITTAGFGLIGFFDDYKKADQQFASRARRGDEDSARNRGRCCGLHRDRPLQPGAARQRPGGAVFQERVDPPRRVVCAVRGSGRRRGIECGQSDRRPRRACDRAGDDRGRLLRIDCLFCRQRDLR